MKFDFYFEREKIIVEPVITGMRHKRKLRFFLDTGANITLIDSSVSAVFGFEQNSRENIVTASGKAKSHQVILPEIEVLGKTLSNFNVSVIDFPYQITLFADGLLGMDFLKQLKRLNIDFENQIIETE
ncbi:MAG: retroviral-like aspartic protease family protein [Dysgonamonadaceae bacterium]|jgi:clan AA aspartic protease (TIGR02281 family)|nr:retroviral-like aspartic protease family protein [Dysgonamonadaceae bacterium]